MTKKDRQVLLVELARSAYGDALRDLVAEYKEEVGDVTKCTTWEDTLGRKHSLEFVKKTFSFLEKPEIPQNTKNTYS